MGTLPTREHDALEYQARPRRVRAWPLVLAGAVGALVGVVINAASCYRVIYGLTVNGFPPSHTSELEAMYGAIKASVLIMAACSASTAFLYWLLCRH